MDSTIGIESTRPSIYLFLSVAKRRPIAARSSQVHLFSTDDQLKERVRSIYLLVRASPGISSDAGRPDPQKIISAALKRLSALSGVVGLSQRRPDSGFYLGYDEADEATQIDVFGGVSIRIQLCLGSGELDRSFSQMIRPRLLQSVVSGLWGLVGHRVGRSTSMGVLSQWLSR
jgi:hypothetical protein